MAARIYYEENIKLTESNVRKFLIFFFNFYISFCDRNFYQTYFLLLRILHFAALLDVRCYRVPDL